MINKKSIWFLTLFSLILVLSVYYITMPSELLLNTHGDYNKEKPVTDIVEKTVLVALRVEADNEFKKEMDTLQLALTNKDMSIDEKNKAFEKMKGLNIKRGEEEKLENLIKDVYKLEAFVKIKNDKIEIVVHNKEHNNDLANKIIRTVQEGYKNHMYITIKFTN
ncbi:MAG: SpoIIIAH-like family protein [Bacilli bacterium]